MERSFDYDGFISELQHSTQQSCLLLDPPSEVADVVECYNAALTTL